MNTTRPRTIRPIGFCPDRSNRPKTGWSPKGPRINGAWGRNAALPRITGPCPARREFSPDHLPHFPIDRVEAALSPSYNAAPAQLVPVIVRQGNENVLRTFRWGLVPFWAKDPSVGSRMINARSETVDVKPSFRSAFRTRRCLMPADGFYEWKGDAGHKQPMLITLPGGELFGFAGLWEVWDDRGKAGEPLYTCTILTTEASPSIRDVHHRMPVILKPEAFDQWIDANTSSDALHGILRARIEREFTTRPVSRAVNATRNNSADLIQER